MMAYEGVCLSNILRKQPLVIISVLLLQLYVSTTCKAAEIICPESSSSCWTAGYDSQYVYRMTCSNLATQEALPAACQYSLIVRELTFDPQTSVIKTLPARALDGLRVRKLVISGVGMESVNESAFEWLSTDLQELSMHGNLLTDLPDGVFSPLSNLVHLELQYNQLTTISKRFLEGLTNLLVLDLSGNRISQIDTEVWVSVPSLSTLRLHDNVIEGVLNSTRLGGLAQLRELQLDGNRVSEVTTDAFRRLPKLRSLSIARNHIPALPNNAFAGNAVLEEVDASENEIVGLTMDVFNETKRLTKLSLHGNRIDTLPIYVFRHMYNLRTLQLHNNLISSFLSNSLSGLSSLRHLSLSHNNIGILPTGVFDPLGLVETLSLAGNRIAVVEQRPFESMRNLLTLDLSGNRLESVDPDWFHTTSRLTELRLDDNRLNSIHPEAFSKVPVLQNLRLDRNLLSSVNGSLFRNCSSVTHLDLSSNPLRRIENGGSVFAGLTALKRLNLISACLTDLSFTSDGTTTAVLPSLEELDLSSNTLTNLSSSTFDSVSSITRLHLAANDVERLDSFLFSRLSNLEMLDLSSNALKSDEHLSAALSILPSSAAVDLSWNLLTSVAHDVLPVLSGGVYLVGNPLRCDCNSSSWLKRDPSLLLDAQTTACLDEETGQPKFLACHWTTCSINSTVSSAVRGSETDCAAPQSSLSYLAVPQRRPATSCPWDAAAPSVHDINVTVISPTSINIEWNLTSGSDVTVTVSSGYTGSNTSGEVYTLPANVTELTVGNLTSGGHYNVCVATANGHQACVAVLLQLTTTTTLSPSLQLRMSVASSESELHVTWTVQRTPTSANITQYRLTWTEEGESRDVSTVWMDSSNTSYTIAGLQPSTTYRVCVQAIGGGDRITNNETLCEQFSTAHDATATSNDPSDMLLIIIIGAAAGGFLFLIVLVIVIICCCCCKLCCRNKEPSKPRMTVRPVESTRSVNRGRLAEHSVVSMSVYENV